MSYAIWLSIGSFAALAIWQLWEIRRLTRINRELLGALRRLEASETQWKRDFFELLEKADPAQATSLRAFEARAIADSQRTG